MELRRAVSARGGIVRVSELRDQGYSRRRIDGAVHRGELTRPIRGWVCTPGLDTDVTLAAQHHVVISCVSRAQRLRLWVSRPPPHLHVAVPHAGAKVRTDQLRVHWAAPMVPRPPGTLEDAIENVLGYVAACLPFEDALATWNSALNQRLVDMRQLETLPWPKRASRILAACTPFADSGLESLVFSRLHWLPVQLRRQVYIAGHRVDLLIGNRLILQIDGAHHTGAQRTSDIAHDARLTQMGYVVIRVSYAQVMHRWEEVQEAVLGAIARGRHA